MYMRGGKNMRGGRNMTKEEFIDNFRNAIQERIPEFNPSNEEITRLFNDYYLQNPKFEQYVDGIELAIGDAFEDEEDLSLNDILDSWDESDVTTVVTETPNTIDDEDDIEDYLGGKKFGGKKLGEKNLRRKKSKTYRKKNKTNKRKTRKSKKSGKNIIKDPKRYT